MVRVATDVSHRMLHVIIIFNLAFLKFNHILNLTNISQTSKKIKKKTQFSKSAQFLCETKALYGL